MNRAISIIISSLRKDSSDDSAESKHTDVARTSKDTVYAIFSERCIFRIVFRQ